MTTVFSTMSVLIKIVFSTFSTEQGYVTLSRKVGGCMNYSVDSIGIDTFHQRGFCHELPGGFDVWVFLQLVTPHLLNEKDTSLTVADAGTCVVYSPGHPRYLYCAPGLDGLRNNFVHIRASDNEQVARDLKAYGIPVNTFFRMRESAQALSTLSELIYENSVVQPHQEAMVSHLVDMLLIQIGRNYIPWNVQEDITQSRNLRSLEKVRKEMYASPEKEWTVRGMATAAFLSENRFILLYKRFFGITPRQDLMRARIVKAKSMLNNDAVMRDVALSCGFKNEYYFSNAFKKMEGMPPSHFLKNPRKRG